MSLEEIKMPHAARDLTEEVEPEPIPTLVRKVHKRALDLFVGNYGLKPPDCREALEAKLRLKIGDEYVHLPDMVDEGGKTHGGGEGRNGESAKMAKTSSLTLGKVIEEITSRQQKNAQAAATGGGPEVSNAASLSFDLVLSSPTTSSFPPLIHAPAQPGQELIRPSQPKGASAPGALHQLALRKPAMAPRPVWHRPWKLMRVIAGHQGWVRCLAVDPNNEWFVSGGSDRLIKIWDLASGTLKLSLTGHINTVRGLEVSARHPYLFSCGEDNTVKCWDLEQNKVIRNYHGHLSGVYCMSLHPGLDILCTGGRDNVVRVWDIRTKHAVYVLSGHRATIMSLATQNVQPQLISGSQDKMVRLWDLAAGKCSSVLTNHKKSVRSLALHPRDYTFCSVAADNVKIWRNPNGHFERNLENSGSVLNCAAIRDEPDSAVLVAGSDTGMLHFWDWRSGYRFQSIESLPQPGSLASESGVFDLKFDKSETRLLTAECDKTIKVWREDPDATPETHPIDWKPPRLGT